MQTTRGFGVRTVGAISTEGMTTMDGEMRFNEVRGHLRELAAEAERERLLGPREGLRQHVGHALIALGRAIHGIEPDPAGRRVLTSH